MQFDDRLATVLRLRADSDAGLRTQFRQLVDLLGTAPEGGDAALLESAYERLEALSEAIPQDERSRILREPVLRLRDPRLVLFLASGDAKPAAAAMATARLRDADWLDIIPRLPVNARGFLRHRRDLPNTVTGLLARLGVQDLLLPLPEGARQTATAAPARLENSPPMPSSGPSASGIGTLLRRIEAFTETRRAQPVAPRLPLDDDAQRAPLSAIEFTTDAAGTVISASDEVAPKLVGMTLGSSNPLADVAATTTAAFNARQPVNSAPLALSAAKPVSGEWLMDAAPLFDPRSGAFTGYRGMLRRPAPAEPAAVDPAADRMRQVLHELRTPVNAIQGFAEIIQQQIFGAVPHEYRAHAAAIAVDAAKLLAGFEEVDRLVKLDAGAMRLDTGEADLRECVSDTVERLQGVLRPRNASLTLAVTGLDFTIALDRREAMALCWRVLATAAGALGPGEGIGLTLTGHSDTVRLELGVPEALRGEGAAKVDPDTRPRAVSAGIFGPRFAFRLAQAEAENAGGSLICDESFVTLALPALTAASGDPSAGSGRAGGS
ncbi:MAG: histidine kinase dimerization/phospho-acceptor domain-containing protein [Alteraurantiacibacter sp.]